MQLKHKDAGAGVLKLQVDTLDDLWTLRNLVQAGDLVTASTYRTAETSDDKLRAEKAEKKPMTLGVRVEDVEWHDFADMLRIHGVIETGPQDIGRHHTLTFRDDRAQLILEKTGRLQQWHLDLLDEAIAATKKPQVLLLAIDDTEAQFGQLASYGLRLLGSLPAGGQGKRFDAKAGAAAKKRFYDETVKSLMSLRPDASVPFLVVGPGWWREEFIEHAQTKAPDLMQGVRTDGTSQGGAAGLREALQRGVVAQVARDHRVQDETQAVDEVMARIAKGDGTVAYGAAEVEAAVTAGAADEVLLTDAAVREGSYPEVIDSAERTRCRVRIVSTGHDAGELLHRMGGVAALLRFAI